MSPYSCTNKGEHSAQVLSGNQGRWDTHFCSLLCVTEEHCIYDHLVLEDSMAGLLKCRHQVDRRGQGMCITLYPPFSLVEQMPVGSNTRYKNVTSP